MTPTLTSAPATPTTIATTPTPTSTPAAPLARVTPSSVDFGSLPLGSFSAALMVSLANSGAVTLTVGQITVTGDGATDFTEYDTCSGGVPAGASCTITLNFVPSVEGTRSAILTIADNAADGSQQVALSGVGVATTVSVTPATLAFGSQAAGTVGLTQIVTVANASNVAQTIGAVYVSDGDFNAADLCSGVTLAPGGACTIGVSFMPLAAGTHSGSMSIIDNAPDSPQTVPLTGIGLASSSATVTATGTTTATMALTGTATMTSSLAGGATPPTPTATPPAHGTVHHAKRPTRHAKRPTPRFSLPLAITAQGRVVGRELLRVSLRLHTVQHARVSAALKAVAATGRAPRGPLRAALTVARSNTMTLPAQAPRRRGRPAAAVALYLARTRAATNRQGRLTEVVQVHYHRARLVAAYLTVTVRTARGATTRTIKVTIQTQRRRPLQWWSVCVSRCGSSH